MKTKQKSVVKDQIEVYCRIRPLESAAEPLCLKAKDKKTVVLFSPETSQLNKIIKEVHYSFKEVFDADTSQKELFDRISLPFIEDVLQGNNGLIFTYGITSSGKTYTMTGTHRDGGLLPRSLDVVFSSIKGYQVPKFVFKPDKLNGFDIQSASDARVEQQNNSKGINVNRTMMKTPRREKTVIDRTPDSTIISEIPSDVNFAVFVSYVEIYNNYIYDLLEDLDTRKKLNLSSKMLRENPVTHNMYVFGVTESEVTTVDEALDLFYKGQMRRKVSNTALNAESSRSHSVFTIRIVQAPLDPQGAEILTDKSLIQIGQLSLVDLAGSERSVRTKNTGIKLREAGNINASLMALRNCIEHLRESQTLDVTRIIPFRESKLTHLFKSYFEGEGKIKMIVCVNPHAEYYDEIIHVMKFAEMTQDVVITRTVATSTPVGLMPGRGKMYREAVKKAKEDGVSVFNPVFSPIVYSLGPEFQDNDLLYSEDELMYSNLIETLIKRKNQRAILTADLEKKQNDFRKCLLDVYAENGKLKKVEMDLAGRKQQVLNLEKKIYDITQEKEQFEKLYMNSQSDLKASKIEAENLKKLLADQKKENERFKIKMQEKLEMDKDRMRRNMERRYTEKLAELERKVYVKDEVFSHLREIINADDFAWNDEPVIPSKPEPHRMSRARAFLDVTLPEPRLQKARSATNFNTGRNGQQSIKETAKLFERDNLMSQDYEKSIPVSNPRHRRSRSNTTEKWIEHKPIGNLDLGTVLQPSMKTKKSVSELKIRDITKPDVSRYILEHQEQDSKGQLETQLYKADVIPSASGGAQVIFNDVETLQQRSPTRNFNSRKRSNDGLPIIEIENRCAVGFENLGNPSKMKKTG
ncbi:hypothetical protein JTE90_001508 [Oedothorax gibbosus]|uniref:Kinesin-like protein n=1 Tax=Oedothorax gibbosus TaxID=931172 RepID=A0AAV6UMG1_9ARAC|nr:hypothetical protein JTE90_001508 [Oedothorax gibbosus]